MGLFRRVDAGGMRILVLGLLGSLGCFTGCAPSWHSGDEAWKLSHSPMSAVMQDDNLVVIGSIIPLVSMTDHGFKLLKAEDDRGRQLTFRSFRTYYAKGLWFLIEFEKPAKSAKAVHLDIVFTSRSGLQRDSASLPIDWDSRPDWRVSGAGGFD